MKTALFSCLITTLCAFTLHAQTTSEPGSENTDPWSTIACQTDAYDSLHYGRIKGPVQMSIYLTGTNGGQTRAILNGIVDAGFSDDIPDQTYYFLGIPVITEYGQSYPIDESKARVFAFAVQQAITDKIGWYGCMSGMQKTDIKGFHMTDETHLTGIQLKAYSNATFFSAGYMVSTPDGTCFVKIGPAIAVANVEVNCTNDLKVKKVLPGLQTECEIHIIKNPAGFIGMHMGYRKLAEIKTEATALHTFEEGTALTLQPMNIRFDYLYFGINAGFNIPVK